MCDDFGFLVLNGRSKCDSKGDFTFINKLGASVIDLALVSIHCLQIVSDFKVIEYIGSDHLPIQLTLKIRKELDYRDEDKFYLYFQD